MQIGCIGAGSWGTTLSVYLAELGQSVALYAHNPEQRSILASQRLNERYLPGVHFPDSLSVIDDLSELANSDVLLIATPTQYIRSTVAPLESLVQQGAFSSTLLVNSSKGIEQKTLLRVSEILNETMQVDFDRIVTLSGPSHAEEVSRGDPAALVAGSSDCDAAALTQELFNSERLRVYTSDDIVGVELGGALKNVIAICTGVVDGLNFGDNTRAALITRGLAEIQRLGVALGARMETFSGLSGLGDLIVTCTSRHSRNRYVGEQIGKGRKLEDVIAEMSMVAEGVSTAKSALELARANDVELPIFEQVNEVLFQGKPTRQAITELMSRTLKQEIW